MAWYLVKHRDNFTFYWQWHEICDSSGDKYEGEKKKKPAENNLETDTLYYT
jgi:hypothetical protein